MMNRRTLTQSAAALAAAACLGWAPAVLAADEAPDALVKRLSNRKTDLHLRIDGPQLQLSCGAFSAETRRPK